MTGMPETRAVAASDVSLLTYAEHMAETARSDAAKRMFEAYVEQERHRLECIAVAGYKGANTGLALKGLTMAMQNGKRALREPHKEDGGKNMRRTAKEAIETRTETNRTRMFAYSANPKARQVYLAGDFNGWDPAALPMSKRGGMFVKRVQLQPGEHQYKFLVDGEWQTDPAAEVQVPNGMGSLNSVVRA